MPDPKCDIASLSTSCYVDFSTTGAVILGNTGSGLFLELPPLLLILRKLTVTSNGGAGAFPFSYDPTITADGGIEFVSGAGNNDGNHPTDEKDLTLTANAADITVTSACSSDGEDFTINIIKLELPEEQQQSEPSTDINDVNYCPTIKLEEIYNRNRGTMLHLISNGAVATLSIDW